MADAASVCWGRKPRRPRLPVCLKAERQARVEDHAAGVEHRRGVGQVRVERDLVGGQGDPAQECQVPAGVQEQVVVDIVSEHEGQLAERSGRLVRRSRANRRLRGLCINNQDVLVAFREIAIHADITFDAPIPFVVYVHEVAAELRAQQRVPCVNEEIAGERLKNL